MKSIKELFSEVERPKSRTLAESYDMHPIEKQYTLRDQFVVRTQTLGEASAPPSPNETIQTAQSGTVETQSGYKGNKSFIHSIVFNTNGDGTGSIVNMNSGGSYYYPTTAQENLQSKFVAARTGRFGESVYWSPTYSKFKGKGVKL
jgi:hypothetical protein